jgi:hypothetical protein
MAKSFPATPHIRMENSEASENDDRTMIMINQNICGSNESIISDTH